MRVPQRPWLPVLSRYQRPFDLGQRSLLVPSDPCGMSQPDKQAPDKEAPKPMSSRSEDAMRLIEAYAADLRELIKKLRRKLN